MNYKNKSITSLASFAGITLMTAAAVISAAHLPEPSVFKADKEHHEFGNNSHRREREETGPHYTSYNSAQRTPARSASL